MYSSQQPRQHPNCSTLFILTTLSYLECFEWADVHNSVHIHWTGTSAPEQGGSVEEKVPASEETWSHAPPGPHGRSKT